MTLDFLGDIVNEKQAVGEGDAFFVKFIHLSDLHLGKRVHEHSMLDDQKYILEEIQNIIAAEAPDAVLIAGDIYDKPVPPTEAVIMFDKFLVDLSEKELPVFVISGNHDSPERLAFGSHLIEASGIYLSPVYDDGTVKPIKLQDDYGEVNIYMLPFIKPASVGRIFPDDEISSFTDMMRIAIRQMNIDLSSRNILVAHQFITGATRSESEEVSVGGLDNIDASVFEEFDYVALGHIHTPQNIETKRVRYAGSPLKYSFSEAAHDKSVTVVELGGKGDLDVREVPLSPMYDMVELKDTFEELTAKSFYEGTSYPHDYVHITLTDENDIPEAMGKLRKIYPNLMKLDYDNTRTRNAVDLQNLEAVEDQSPFDLFSEFYEKYSGVPMSDEQADFMKKLIEESWGEKEK